MKVEENRFSNVHVDLLQDPAPFPLPGAFSWMKDGLPLTNLEQQLLLLTYSNITFPTIERQYSGHYIIFATNTDINDPTRPIGNDTGSFYLDVICKIKNI